jgi:hypothetical protein
VIEQPAPGVTTVTEVEETRQVSRTGRIIDPPARYALGVLTLKKATVAEFDKEEAEWRETAERQVLHLCEIEDPPPTPEELDELDPNDEAISRIETVVETTKKVDRARSRLPTETNISANGAMAKKMGRALTPLLAVANTLAIGGIAKETGAAPKRTLMEVATLANGGTAQKVDEAPKRTLTEVATLVSSEMTKDMDRARSRGLVEANMSANGEITKKIDRAPIHFSRRRQIRR